MQLTHQTQPRDVFCLACRIFLGTLRLVVKMAKWGDFIYKSKFPAPFEKFSSLGNPGFVLQHGNNQLYLRTHCSWRLGTYSPLHPSLSHSAPCCCRPSCLSSTCLYYDCLSLTLGFRLYPSLGLNGHLGWGLLGQNVSTEEVLGANIAL